jgi:hypothetical protein
MTANRPRYTYVLNTNIKKTTVLFFFQKMTFATAISCTLESHGKVTLGHVMLVGCA